MSDVAQNRWSTCPADVIFELLTLTDTQSQGIYRHICRWWRHIALTVFCRRVNDCSDVFKAIAPFNQQGWVRPSFNQRYYWILTFYSAFEATLWNTIGPPLRRMLTMFVDYSWNLAVSPLLSLMRSFETNIANYLFCQTLKLWRFAIPHNWTHVAGSLFQSPLLQTSHSRGFFCATALPSYSYMIYRQILLR